MITRWICVLGGCMTLMFAATSLASAQAIDPATFDAKFAGYYQQGTEVLHFFRQGDQYFAQGTGQPPVALTIDSATQFSAAPGRLTFQMNGAGEVTDVVLNNARGEFVLPRIEKSRADKIAAEQQKAAARTAPNPGTEAALRKQITALQKGAPDFDGLAEPILSKMHQNAPDFTAMLAKLGAVKSLRFKSAMGSDADVFEVTFERGEMEWVVSALTPDGKISHLATELPVAR